MNIKKTERIANILNKYNKIQFYFFNSIFLTAVESTIIHIYASTMHI